MGKIKKRILEGLQIDSEDEWDDFQGESQHLLPDTGYLELPNS